MSGDGLAARLAMDWSDAEVGVDNAKELRSHQTSALQGGDGSARLGLTFDRDSLSTVKSKSTSDFSWSV
jgi:hypothetical protein